ncbi:MAG: serine/threonine-protein kinase [Myxococcota bacterium]
MDAARTWTEGGAEPEAQAPAELAHGRYVVGDLIGAGGCGQVHAGVDRATGESVAIKFVPALSAWQLARARREVAALRWLRLPGVVRLRDDGLDGASWFIVMDRVDGAPFGSAVRGRSWVECRPVVLELLEVLARVHLSGVLHLDLKPANVLVTPDDRVVVLDFGIARGQVLPTTGAGGVEGTPRYMAPEQLRGGPCDARTDLYALGAMWLEVIPDLPPEVRAVAEAMRSERPDDRPGSAIDVFVALAGHSPFPARLTRAEPWTEGELRSLFGPDPFGHVAEDAARWVWQHTWGEPAAVRATLEGWLAAGAATWSDDSLLMDRAGFERVADPIGWLEGPEVVEQVLTRSRALRHAGRLDAAAALLDAAAPLARSSGLDAERKVLEERVLAAIATERPAALELALFAIDCATPTRATAELGDLTRLARAALRRDAGAAAEQLSRLPALAHPELEIRRQGFGIYAAALRGLDHEAQALAALDGWVGEDPARAAKRAGLLGNHLYRRGDYVEAARAHERAAAHKGGAEGVGSLVNAASAWLEALELERAMALATDALHQARALRHATFEALARWLVRTAAYRLGEPHPVAPELVDAAAALKPYLGALYALTDAAAAYRSRDERFPSLARRAATLAQAHMPPFAHLTAAFAAHAVGDIRMSWALASRADHGPIPDIELQVLAFARWTVPDPPEAWLDRMITLAASRPKPQWSARLDVTSIDEALADCPP